MKLPLAKARSSQITRRAVLKGLSFAPLLLKPAPVLGFPWTAAHLGPDDAFAFGDVRLSPHYPSESPLSDIFRLVEAGSDDYKLEKHAMEIEALLNAWGDELRKSPQSGTLLADFIGSQIKSSDIPAAEWMKVRSGYGIETLQRSFVSTSNHTREQFVESIRQWLKPASGVETAEFEIFGIQQLSDNPATLRADIRYDIVLVLEDDRREERVGSWQTEWWRDESRPWHARVWRFTEETSAVVHGKAFADVTASVFAGVDSYKHQLMHGADYWRTVIDGAVGVDVYGNQGLAAGDFDGDGWDDLYVCQAAGLPNRLYRNRGDGTFEDVTEKAGVGVLDRTACALFADFLNRGRQDLLVVCDTGPILFLNNGDGAFSIKKDAFRFARPPQGSFTHAAVVDYDNDGRLDVYFCLYMYYLGLEQYNYPTPYYDARNGPPNCLMRNLGDGTFAEMTEESGLNVNNNRYSFACAWGDSNGNGLPDLFVANDFGSSQLYRNNGDGTFKDVSKEANVESVGAGMGCCWADFDNNGHQDIYVPSMWEAAGQRVSTQPQFHPQAPQSIRDLYQRHARGNALYRNLGDGTFRNVGHTAGVEMGRWSWSSDFCDWDHDGYDDLYVSNGYLTGPVEDELAGFFWRQVVAKSPEDATPMLAYERGWNAINELVRADHTWHGLARSVAFVNNGNGTFTEASGALLLDLKDDARAFVLADIDHDGRLEIILKNRSAPQIRVLQNGLPDAGNSISFRLRGSKSNRDAVGARVEITANGVTQTRYLQAGTGFLSQHSKELFFGLGSHGGVVAAKVRWPSGLTQEFANLSPGNQIWLEEGASTVQVKPFERRKLSAGPSVQRAVRETLPSQTETWLIQPLKAPEFKLEDIDRVEHSLDSWRGSPVLLTFWSTAAPQSLRQLERLKSKAADLEGGSFRNVAINLDESGRRAEARKAAAPYLSRETMLFATEELSGVYNILFRHLFDRRRDLPVPCSLLLDGNGMIVKVYQGIADLPRVAADAASIPGDQDRIHHALPFAGLLVGNAFERNEFTYGVALYQHGFLDQAAESFQQVITSKPDNADAYYNLGTLNLRRNRAEEARLYLRKTVDIRPGFAEAWNNLGMLAAQQDNAEEAIQDFQRSISISPSYFTAHLNLGNVYRKEHDYEDAQRSLSQALSLRPDDPEVHYSLGMLFAQQNDLSQAAEHLQQAIALRPAYPEALNNLGVIYVKQRVYPKAEEQFLSAVHANPSYDQPYLNLARLYAMQSETQKARDLLQQLLQIQPDNANAKRALEVLQ